MKAEANAVSGQLVRTSELPRGPARPPQRHRGETGGTDGAREPASSRQAAEAPGNDPGPVRQTALLAPEDNITPAERFYQRYLDSSRLTLTYRLDPDSGDLLAEILERYGRKEIRQIPPEHVVAYAARFNEWLGFILDVRA